MTDTDLQCGINVKIHKVKDMFGDTCIQVMPTDKVEDISVLEFEIDCKGLVMFVNVGVEVCQGSQQCQVGGIAGQGLQDCIDDE